MEEPAGGWKVTGAALGSVVGEASARGSVK